MATGLGLALSATQREDLRTTANPLPVPLRARYWRMVGEALRGCSSVGDAELHRLAHGVVGALLKQHDDERLARRVDTATLRGFGESP